MSEVPAIIPTSRGRSLKYLVGSGLGWGGGGGGGGGFAGAKTVAYCWSVVAVGRLVSLPPHWSFPYVHVGVANEGYSQRDGRHPWFWSGLVVPPVLVCAVLSLLLGWFAGGG